MRPSHYNSRYKDHLTPRQRQVADLLTRGKTNGEIAVELDLGWETVKSHVSEVLAKLGVDTREEAAAYWRHERSIPATAGRIGRGLLWFLWPRWAVGAGAVVSVATAAVLVVFLLGGDDREIGGEGVWLAFASEQESVGNSALHVVNLETNERNRLSESTAHLAVDFSPDGTLLAALTLDPREVTERSVFKQKLKIWSVPGWKLVAEEEIRGTDSALDFAWSPDSTRIVLFQSNGQSIYDLDGELVGSVLGTPNPDGSVVGSDGDYGNRSWSPDSQFAARIFNNRLLVASRDGSGWETQLPEGDEPGGRFSQSSLVEWVAPYRLRVAVGLGAQTVMVFTGTVRSNAVAWDAGDRVPTDELQEVDLARAPEFEKIVVGSVYGGTSRLHDGVSEVSVLQSEAVLGAGLRAVWLVVTSGGEQTLVHLGEQQPRGTFSTFDLAITPGASRDLPGEINLSDYGLEAPVVRKPEPRQPTPDPAAPRPGVSLERPPNPTYSPPDPNVTVIPYPTPSGERIQPQLMDIPVLPGAEEVDGFTFTDREGVEAAVQHFAVQAMPDHVMDFYWDELIAMGYMPYARASSEGGEQWNFSRGGDQVHIRTEYLSRDPNYGGPIEQLSGYRGQNARFLEGADGKTWFFVITIRGE